MSDSKPCPLCGGLSKSGGNFNGKEDVCCINTDCLLFYVWIRRCAWQALPRPSETATKLAQELRGLVAVMPKGSRGAQATADDIERIADAVAASPCAPTDTAQDAGTTTKGTPSAATIERRRHKKEIVRLALKWADDRRGDPDVQALLEAALDYQEFLGSRRTEMGT